MHALDGVDAAFRERELVVVLGPSGSGKTTLLNLLGGLDRPTAGSIRYGAVDLARLTDREVVRDGRKPVLLVRPKAGTR